MTKFKLLAAAAVVTSLVASPVLAKDATHHTDKKTMKVHKAGKQARSQTWRNDRAADVQYDRGYDRRAAYGNSGFWPADVAAGVVGGAVNTAGAIASAPFRDTYAYDDSFDDGYASAPRPVYRSNWDNGWNNTYNNNWNNSWARRQSVQEGGFVCTPGTSYTNSYGYTQLCQ